MQSSTYRRVLISEATSITEISWLDATVSVDLTRQAVKDAPAYDGKTLPDREQERSLIDHYGRNDHRNAVAGRPLPDSPFRPKSGRRIAPPVPRRYD